MWAHFCSVVLKTAWVLHCLHQLSASINDQQLKRMSVSRAATAAALHVLVTDIPADVDGPTVLAAVWGAPAPLAAGGGLTATYPVFECAELEKMEARSEALSLQIADAEWALLHGAKGIRPRHRTGLCGLTGPWVDTLTVLEAERAAIEAKAAEICAAAPRGPDACSKAGVPLRRAVFAVFTDARAATVAAQAAVGRDAFSYRLRPAPEPANVYWPNVGRLSHEQRAHARWVGTIVTLCICLFFMIPVAFAQSLATLSNLTRMLPVLKPAVKLQPVKAIIEGVLPGIVLLVFLAFLPAIFKCIAARVEGLETHSALQLSVLRRLCLFGFLNVFLGSIVAGSVFGALKTIVSRPVGAVSAIATAIPATSRFFMTLVLLKSFTVSSYAIKSLIYLVKSRLLAKSPTSKAAAWAPAPEALEVDISGTLLILLLVIVFTTLQPVMHVVGMLYFIPALVAAKQAAFFTHEAPYEGGAALWPAIRKEVVQVLVIYQITMTVALALKVAPAQAVLTFACVPVTLGLHASLAKCYRGDEGSSGKSRGEGAGAVLS